MKKSEDFSKLERIKKDLKNEDKELKEEVSKVQSNLEKYRENPNFKYIYPIIYKRIFLKQFGNQKEEKKKVIYRVKKMTFQQKFFSKFNFLLKEVDSNLLFDYRLKL